MKITIESYGKKYSTELNCEDCGIDEYIDVFTNLLMCNGFHIETVRDALKDYLKETET